MTTTDIIKITTMALLGTLLVGRYAQAAESPVITLSCDGTITDTRASDAKPESINKMGLVVNLAEHTVSFAGYVVRIDNVDAANISFDGESTSQLGESGPKMSFYVMGAVDRVTGAAQATTMSKFSTFSYDLLCKPAARLF
jgi:hypothetical protein